MRRNHLHVFICLSAGFCSIYKFKDPLISGFTLFTAAQAHLLHISILLGQNCLLKPWTVISQAVSPLNPLQQQWSPPSLPPSHRVLPLCLTPQEEGVVVQDYSAVSVSEQLWVRPAHQTLNQSPSRGTCVVQSRLLCGLCDLLRLGCGSLGALLLHSL